MTMPLIHPEPGWMRCAWTGCTTYVHVGIGMCQVHRWHRAKDLDLMWETNRA